MDKIIISNLEVFGHHGVYEEENKLGQKFIVSATLYLNLRNAGQTDKLDLSINYGSVCKFINEFMTDNTFYLIEAAAEMLAQNLLLSFSRIKMVELEIKKPWAPIGLPLEMVSVSIKRGWHKAYLSLGSNMGNREEYIQKSIEAMEADELINIIDISDFIITEPYGFKEQGEFLNGALVLDTLYTPEELLDKLHQFEIDAGRERNIKWGPRTLDLDIIMYDDLVMDTAELTIPHIDMQNREFVLKPLSQVAPYLRHPILNKTIIELYNDLLEKNS